MRKLLAGLGAAVFIAACAGGAVPGLMMAQPAQTVTASSPHIVAAVADPRRPGADRERDALRHPAEVMAFAGVQPGWRVADVGPGGGYYTRLLSVAVGPEGRVYGVDRAGTAERPRPLAAFAAEYGNITHLTDGYQGWTISEPLDAVFVSQIYHDWFYPQLNLDVPGLNRKIYDALRPGGVYVIIDHAAVAGHTINPDPQSDLHRIDQAQVIREVTAAGFVLEAESQVLRNPADNRSLRVFEGDIRGHTDQFMLRFRKPAN
jgi:predicted methyltransferase